MNILNNIESHYKLITYMLDENTKWIKEFETPSESWKDGDSDVVDAMCGK